MKLKEKNPDLKILISCGGWGKAGEFDSLIGSQSSRSRMFHSEGRLSDLCFFSRETFSNNVITFCRQHGFDGVDLDWEFPSADHRERFGLLTKVTSTFASTEEIDDRF